MKIEFNELVVRNFMSIGPEVRFDYRLHSGINYVFGHNRNINNDIKNGTGKSLTFIDAITYALFGFTSKKLNKTNIPNRQVGKDCYVSLDFTVNGVNYIIENSIKPNFVKLTKRVNGVDEDITKSGSKETYQYITDEILKTSYSVFKNTVLLSPADVDFIFKLEKGEKRKFTERIFNVLVFGEIYRVVKDDINTIAREITTTRNNVNSLTQELESLSNKKSNFEIEKQKNIEKYKQVLANYQTELSNLIPESGENYIDSLRAQQEEMKLIQTKKDEVTKRISEFTATIRADEAKIVSNNRVLKIYCDIFNNVCVQCNETLNKIIKYDDAVNDIQDCNIEIDDLKGKITKLQDYLLKKESQRKAVDQRITSIQTELSIQKDQLITKNNLQNNIKVYTEKIENEIETKCAFDEIIEEKSKCLESNTNKLTEYLEKKKYLDYILFMCSEEGLKKELITNLMGLLNQRIANHLEQMGCEYTVIIDAEFEFEFLTTTGPCEYSNFSNGECRRIVLATIFAIRDLLYGQGSMQSNILVLDELLDGAIDNYAIEAILKFLKEEAKKQTIYLITHREAISQDLFDNVVEIEKINGFTRIKNDVQGGIL